MKKSIFFASLLASSVALAQTGRVGVNTATPVRTLDVEGDLRVKTVTDKSADAAYTNVLVQNPTTGLVDALPSNSAKFTDGSGNEPWQVIGSSTKATANTQNIYQNAQVGIGFTSGTGMSSLSNRTNRLQLTGGDLVIDGLQIGRGANGQENVVLGRYSTFANNTTGFGNFITGTNACLSCTTASNNFIYGDQAAYYTVSGKQNIVMGVDSFSFGNGNYSVALGARSGYRFVGDYNIAIGSYSGFNSGFQLAGNKNTFIGSNTSYNNPDITNSTAVGADITLTDSNTVILGNNASVGIGTTAPTQKLDVIGNARISALLDGSAFPNVVMADANGVLGKTTAASISSVAEPWQVVGSTTKATANTQSVYMNSQVGIGDFTAATASIPVGVKLRVVKGDNQFLGDGNDFSDLYATYAGDNGQVASGLIFSRSRGTMTARTASQQGDLLGTVQFQSHDGTAFGNFSGIMVQHGADANKSIMTFHSPITLASPLVTSATTFLRFNEDRSTTIGNLLDGANTTDFPRNVVAKADGTLGYVEGEVRNVRTASIPTTTMTSQDHLIMIFSGSNDRVVLPPNPKKGQIVKIISTGDQNTIISTSATSTSSADGFLPNRAGTIPANGLTYTADDYRNNIKPRTLLELVFFEAGFANGSGWIQISGDNQL